MPLPIVLVPTDRVEHDDLAWAATPVTYLDALAAEGLLPAQVPALDPGPDPHALLDTAAGVLITGAKSNVHPHRYGEAESERSAPYDPPRDAASFALIHGAIARKLPLLAICRGIQELNVALGGTLHPLLHEIPGRADHRALPEEGEAAWRLRHEVSLADDGLLRTIVGAPRIAVNSLHYQGLARLAPGLRVEALADDGTVEAVSVASHPFALAVQWHPEHFARSDAPSRAIFAAFGRAVRARAAHHAEAA